MIDLHSHILPGLDDGALDLADSLAMARVAERDGITVVCATPHIRDDHDVRIGELGERIGILQEALTRAGVSVRIARGGEVSQLSVDRLSAADLRSVSLDCGGWILLEPGPGPLGAELPDLVERLAARTAGTILAHPERHGGEGFEKLLRELAGRGCLIQWTAEFLAGFDPASAETPIPRLAREGLVHLIASDAHSSHGGRPLKLSHGVRWLQAVCSAERVDWIVREAQALVLEGRPVRTPW